jgi:PAS domain-containing protein
MNPEKDKIIELQSQNAALKQKIEVLESNQKIFNTLLEISLGSIEQDSFNNIAIKLSEWLNAECVIIGQVTDENKVIASPMYQNGKISHDFTYDLKDSPCDLAIKRSYCTYSENIIELFPEDEDLTTLKAEGYVGIALYNKEGKANGILCAISHNKLQLPPQSEKMLKLIGTRISAEIDRKKEQERIIDTNKQLKSKIEESNKLSKLLHQTNEKLAISEKHFRLIAETASDANWVFNVIQEKFLYVSPTIYNLLGFTVEEAFLQNIDQSFTPESSKKLKELMAILISSVICGIT